MPCPKLVMQTRCQASVYSHSGPAPFLMQRDARNLWSGKPALTQYVIFATGRERHGFR